MSGLFLSKGLYPEEFFRPTVDFLLRAQQADGSIPWFDGGHADPWDHVESAMGLSIGGEFRAAELAYYWLRDIQLPDGSWWAAYRNGDVDNCERRETNFVAYIATGVWHHYLISKNCQFLRAMWPCVQSAMEFVLAQQSSHGEINWAVNADGEPLCDALVTGCSSIYKSLECAWNISVSLDDPRPKWRSAREALGQALRNKPERFDRTWESKARYSMDWFYPVLTGALPRAQASAHLQRRWNEFVEEGMGCRCVADQPWVTVAESCELTMALLAAGDHARAVVVYSWLHQWRESNGEYWTGYQFAEDLLWPNERPTWTAAAILLAADALTEHSAAHHLFKEVRLLRLAESATEAELERARL
ncbi:prenyltransferase [Spongiibacter sp. KMU-166]|uniref:Prenyltransferase n=1 Tax=Spongiibacter thalassae TaxID=2721624 RepID=A0ABX1GGQ8_9GAMM|nr:prenyltransferase [Spongiibacter thalassae]NKI18120.1 prenyltransferase [Spongiibacter thalassae]